MGNWFMHRWRWRGIYIPLRRGSSRCTHPIIRHATPLPASLALSRRFSCNSKTPFQLRACPIRDYNRSLRGIVRYDLFSHHRIFPGQVLYPFRNRVESESASWYKIKRLWQLDFHQFTLYPLKSSLKFNTERETYDKLRKRSLLNVVN